MATTKILVVDDSNTIQKVIRIALSKFALEVVSAGSYAEALGTIAEVQPDVILADCALVGTQGAQDFTRLALEAGGAPVILLVGSFEDFDEQTFRSSGFRLFVHKPFESTDIVKAVGDALGTPLSLKKGGATPPVMEKKAADPESVAKSYPERPSATPSGGTAETKQTPPPLPARKPRAPAPPPPPAFASEKKRQGDNAARASEFHMEGEDTKEIDSSHFSSRGGVSIPVETIIQDTQSMVAKTIQAELEHQLPAQVEVAVRRFLENYCERHFKTLAKEILVAEIRRLTDEKARQVLED